MNNKVYDMSFAKVYPLLINKAKRKGHERDDVDLITSWLTGYTRQELDDLMNSDISYGDFYTSFPTHWHNFVEIIAPLSPDLIRIFCPAYGRFSV